MKARLKVICYFILEFILSLVVLGVVGLFLVKETVYSPNFVKEQFKESDYYTNLYSSIQNEMSNIVVQAGLDESALENIYTKEMLTKVMDEILDGIYSGKTVQVNTGEVKENLNHNINQYLEKNNIVITDQQALDKFVTNILKIYTDEITLSSHINKAEKVVSKTKSLVNIGLIVSIVVAIVMILFIKMTFKETTLAMPCLTTGLILLFGYLLVTSNVTIDNIFIWDVKVAELIQQILYAILSKIQVYGIVLVGLGCVDALVVHLVKEMKKR